MNLFGQNSFLMNKHLSITDFSMTRDIEIRPTTAVDVDLVWQLHQHLSSDSIYKRYHSPRVPSRAEMAEMCGLNEENACTEQSRSGRSFIAIAPGKTQIAGMAYYITQSANPQTAEPALLVADAFQGQGIGRRLMKYLVEQAVTQGIRYFDALVLPSNGSMIHLLNNSGRLIENRLLYGAREMRVQLGDLL